MNKRIQRYIKMPPNFFEDILTAAEINSLENLQKMKKAYDRGTMFLIGLTAIKAKTTLTKSRAEFDEDIEKRKGVAKEIKAILTKANKLNEAISKLPVNKYEVFYSCRDKRSDWDTFDMLLNISSKPEKLNSFDSELNDYIETLSNRYDSVKIPANKPRLLDDLTSFVKEVIIIYEKVTDEGFTIYEHRVDGEVVPMTKGHRFVSKFCELISMEVNGVNIVNVDDSTHSYSPSQIYTACRNAKKDLQEKSKAKAA